MVSSFFCIAEMSHIDPYTMMYIVFVVMILLELYKLYVEGRHLESRHLESRH